MSVERDLVLLGRALEVPDAPELTGRVRAALEPRRPAWTLERRRLALAVALAVLAALGATLAIPDARSALLRVLDIGGERIVRVDDLPEVETGGLARALGDEVTLARARATAGFPIRLLEGEPPPDRVYLGSRGTVWLLWGTPQRARLLLAQTQELAVGSPPLMEKLVMEGTSVEPVSVGGRPGWFLSGEPHIVHLVDTQGEIVQEQAWLARNVLVWEAEAVTYRLEGELDAEEALELARSLR